MHPEHGSNWTPDDTFGSRLLLVRRALQLTTEEAAAACGLVSPTWNTWENGSTPRKLNDVVEKISQALGVDRDWLMWGLRSRCLSILPAHRGQMELPLLPQSVLAAV